MERFLAQHVPLAHGKLAIPEGLTKLRLDVGTCFNAPMSQLWLEQDPHLCVYGFEPVLASIDIMRRGRPADFPASGSWIEPEHFNRRFFILPCALAAWP